MKRLVWWIALALFVGLLASVATIIPRYTERTILKDGFQVTTTESRSWIPLARKDWGVTPVSFEAKPLKGGHSSRKVLRFVCIGVEEFRQVVRTPVDPEGFGPTREYRLIHLVGTTGPDDYVKLPDGSQIALDYDGNGSDSLALGAFMGLRWQVLDANAKAVVLVGRIGKTTHMSNPPAQNLPTPEPMRDFRLEHWYLKPPFARFREDSTAALDGPRPAERRAHLQRSDFVAKEGYGFVPDDPRFDPRRYEGPLSAGETRRRVGASGVGKERP